MVLSDSGYCFIIGQMVGSDNNECSIVNDEDCYAIAMLLVQVVGVNLIVLSGQGGVKYYL
jgi:hypothetical protein